MVRQARCLGCHIHFLWLIDRNLEGACCYYCGSPLSRTSYQCRDRDDGSPPVYPEYQTRKGEGRVA